MDSSVYPAHEVIQSSKRAVMLYANQETTHGMTEVPKGREKVKTCGEQFGITCDDHVNVFMQTNSLFFKGTILMPTHILCKADGTEIERKVGAMSAKEFIAMLDRGVKAMGAGLDTDTYELFTKGFADVQAALDKKDHKAALKKCAEMEKKKGPGTEKYQERVKKLEDGVNEAGMAMLEQANEKIKAGDKKGAKDLVLDVIADFDPLPCVKAAKTLLAELKKGS